MMVTINTLRLNARGGPGIWDAKHCCVQLRKQHTHTHLRTGHIAQGYLQIVYITCDEGASLDPEIGLPLPGVQQRKKKSQGSGYLSGTGRHHTVSWNRADLTRSVPAPALPDDPPHTNKSVIFRPANTTRFAGGR